MFRCSSRPFFVVLLLLWSVGAGFAQDLVVPDPPAVSAADRGAIRKVISAQIAAFKRDDAAAAFAFATPALQQNFGDAQTFLAMVRKAYPAVYRPRDVSFGDVEDSQGQLVQKVEVVGADGVPVLALYTMEHEADGTWRISACVLARTETRGA